MSRDCWDTTLQIHNVVTVYLKSKELLALGFALYSIVCQKMLIAMWSASWVNVFQHGGDWERSLSQGYLKNAHNFLLMLRQMNWACDIVAKMLLISYTCTYNQPIVDLRTSLRYDHTKKSPTVLISRHLWLRSSSHIGDSVTKIPIASQASG